MCGGLPENPVQISVVLNPVLSLSFSFSLCSPPYLHTTSHSVYLCSRNSRIDSVAQLCPTLCDPMDCSTPGLCVPHHLPTFAQVHVHCTGDAIQPSHPLMTSSPSALDLSTASGTFPISRLFTSGDQNIYSSSLLAKEDTFQGSQRMPKTMDSTESLYTAFSCTYMCAC